MNALPGHLDRVLQRVRGSGLLLLVEDRRSAAVLAIVYGTLTPTALGVLAIVLFAFDEESFAALLAAEVVVMYAALAVLLRSGRLRQVAMIDLWTGAPVIIGGHILLGGWLWSGGYLLWGIPVVVAAAIFLDRRQVYLLTGTFAGAALLLTPFEPTLRAMRDQPSFWLSVIVMASITLFSLFMTAPVVVALADRARTEQARNRHLMLNILPESIADRLKAEPGMIADRFEACTIVFADLVGFTEHSKGKDPERIVGELNTIFTRFDTLAAEHSAEKIKTIGDGYMAATGLPDPVPDHVRHACDLALAMVDAMPGLNAQLGTDFRLRVGVNTGSAVAGVVGTSRFSYDVWGDTVNLASRLESNGAPGVVAVSSGVASALEERYDVAPLGVKNLKGQGPTELFRLLGPAGALV